MIENTIRTTRNNSKEGDETMTKLIGLLKRTFGKKSETTETPVAGWIKKARATGEAPATGMPRFDR